jgi:hypothetical protein
VTPKVWVLCLGLPRVDRIWVTPEVWVLRRGLLRCVSVCLGLVRAVSSCERGNIRSARVSPTQVGKAPIQTSP